MPTSKLVCLLALAAIVFSQLPSGRSQQEVVECEECRQYPADLPPLPAPALPPDVANKWDLWTHGTLLRGANIWQKCLGTAEAPCTSFETNYDNIDFEKLRAWGANYVNISYPGIFSEQPFREGGRGPLAYRKIETALSNLIRLIDLCRDNKLFVVISFRTGPGRNEAVFDKDERNPLTALWQTEGGVLTPEAVAAQDAWVEMWREAACRLKNKSNVIGYDLMVESQQERERQKGENKQEIWFVLARKLVEAIRCQDRRTPILIGGADESSACKLSCIDPDRFGRYGRIVYTAHQYHP
jgi:Cellulase (glycosyl hydrolase family 5)